MVPKIEAVYEKGNLRPLQPLDLNEADKVMVSVSLVVGGRLSAMLDHQFVAYARAEISATKDVPTLEEVQRQLSTIEGSMSEAIIAERGDYWVSQFFFDTSAFAKRYHLELGSDRIASIFQSPNSTFQISNLGVLEAQSAFAMKVRTGQITPAKAGAFQWRVLSDVAAGTVYVITLEPTHFTAAGLLVAKYGFGRRMRTLDAIQLAVALDLPLKGCSMSSLSPTRS
jgi:predicted DNA-binding antitoxin AbrB/MazE fold protein